MGRSSGAPRMPAPVLLVEHPGEGHGNERAEQQDRDDPPSCDRGADEGEPPQDHRGPAPEPDQAQTAREFGGKLRIRRREPRFDLAQYLPLTLAQHDSRSPARQTTPFVRYLCLNRARTFLASGYATRWEVDLDE